MDMFEKMIEEWKKELIEAGEIDPSEQLSQKDIQKRYQDYQIKKMKSAMGDIQTSLGITIAEKEKPKKKKPTKPVKAKPKKTKKKMTFGLKERAEFSQLFNEIQDLHKSLESRFTHNRELFNALCSTSCPELLESINCKKDADEKMKDIQKIMKNLIKKSENGFPAPSDFEDEFDEYIDQFDESNEVIKSIYSQIEEKSELLEKSISEMEDV